MGNSSEIERKDLDDTGKRNNNKNSYKNRYFEGKRVATDEYSGETIYYSYKGKNNTTSQRHYTTQKTANVDHIKPIDKVRAKYKKDIDSGKITKEQLREITNSDYNLALTSERRNKAKGGKSNLEYLKDQLTIENIKSGNIENFNTSFTMIQKQIQADTAIAYNVESYKLNNFVGDKFNVNQEVLTEFTQNSSCAVASGAGAAFMSMTVSAVNNIVLIATEKKDVQQAVIDIATDTGVSFFSATGLDLLQYSLRKSADKISSNAIKNILTKDLPIQEISSAVMIGGSIVRFINDEINAEECLTEIIMNGIGSLAYSLGMAIGGPAGAIVSTIVVGQINSIILEYQNMIKLNEAQNKRVLEIKSKAMQEMEKQQLDFKLAVEKAGCWDKNIKEGFEEIIRFSCEESYDLECVTNGLDKILSVYGKRVKFKTLEEYEKQLEQPLILRF